MSASNREVAHRVFAAEYDGATFSYSESDEERAPNYVVTPTGARVNRLFLVGVLTEVEQVSDDVLRARVADPTGAFVVYAGQYQPDEMAFLEEAEPPLFVAVTGKANTFSPDDSDRVYTSIRPESINEVDADTRDRWTVQAAEQTLARVATARAAMDLDAEGDALRDALRESGVPGGLAAGIPKAFAEYGTTEHYLASMADLAVDALELVAGEADEVPSPSVTPGDVGDGTVDAATLAAGVEGAVVDLRVPDGVATPADDAGATEAAGELGGSPEPADGDGQGGADDEATAGEAQGTEPAADTATSATEDAGSSTTDDATATGTAGDDEAATADDGPDDIGDFEPGGVSAEDDGASDEAAGDEAQADEDDDGAAADSSAVTDEPVEDVLDDEERERLEEEYGTFSTGTEVDEPGEADIEPEAGPIEPPEDADVEAGAAAGRPESASGASDEGTPASEESSAVSDSGPDTEEPGEPAAGEAPEDESGTDDATAEEPAAEEPETDDEPAEPAEDVDLEAAAIEAMGDLDDGDGADHEAVVAAVVDEHGADPAAVEDAIEDALMAGKCYEPADGKVKPI